MVRGGIGAILMVATTACALFREAPPPPAPSLLDRADADMRRVVEAWRGLEPKPLATLAAAEARWQPTLADAVAVVTAREGRATERRAVAKVENRAIQGPAGSLPIRVYTPEGEGPHPVVVYFHGGGWATGGLDAYDASARAIAAEADAVVVAAEVRRAPEHKFPAAHEDAWAVYDWAQRNERAVGGERNRVAVAGEGAGGNLAFGIALRARETKQRQPVYQVLIQPAAGTDTTTPSYREAEAALPVDAASAAWQLDQYLSGPSDAADPRLDLLRTAELREVAPATILTAGLDPLRSEGEALARALRQAGVGVALHGFPGATHDFFGAGAAVEAARRAQRVVGLELRQAFAVLP